MITRADARASTEPITGVGPLHQKAIDILTNATGNPSELAELEKLARNATGEEQELIGWQIEGWIVKYGAALIPPPPPA
jgi:hypothetical protein